MSLPTPALVQRPARRGLAAACCLAAALAPQAARAQAPVPASTPAEARVLARQDVSLSAANALIEATLAACRAEGYQAVVAVVDRGGNLLALQRGDAVGPHNTLAAQRKAFTALSTRTPTRQLAERARSDPQSQNLHTVAELLLLGGGVPIRAGDEVIGALGVAGAGGSERDERCAATAIEQVMPRAAAAAR